MQGEWSLTKQQKTGSSRVAGNDLQISLDVNIQLYAQQLAYQVMEQKNAKKVSVIVMDPRNGELLAMVNAPEFDLNDPFTRGSEFKKPEP